jgi:hypothetical protein
MMRITIDEILLKDNSFIFFSFLKINYWRTAAAVLFSGQKESLCLPCQGFREKYYPERSGGVEIFPETPQGPDLDWAKEAWRYLCPKKREGRQGSLYDVIVRQCYSFIKFYIISIWILKNLQVYLRVHN